MITEEAFIFLFLLRCFVLVGWALVMAGIWIEGRTK